MEYPEKIYVKYEECGEDEKYLAAYETPEEISDENDEIEVAIYKLEKMVKIKNVTTVEEKIEKEV